MKPNFQQDFPIISIQSHKIVVGGMWGGKFIVYHIKEDSYESLLKHSGIVTTFAVSE